jgi:hypothetical protein
MILILNFLLDLVFLTPLLFWLLLANSYFSNLFSSSKGLLIIYILLGMTIGLFIIFGLSIVASYLYKKFPFLSIFNSLYQKHKWVMAISFLYSYPVFFILGVFIKYGTITDIFILQTIIFVGLIILSKLRFYVALKVIKISTIFILLVSAIGTGFLLSAIYAESKPRYYLTFPLDDKKGKYLINYDGDYWLTYYVVKTNCSNQQTAEGKEKKCSEELIKRGNTSITNSPVDLKPYLDNVPVQIEGTFVPIISPIYGTNKKFCLLKDCRISNGPGTWYASPIKIESISIDKNN